MDDLEKKKVENLILGYLERKREEGQTPGDTLEGITRWWLELERIDVSVDQVAEACLKLEKQGIIKTKKSSSGKIIYQAVYNEKIEN